MRHGKHQRRASNGRAFATFAHTNEGRPEIRLAIGLGGGRFMNVGLSIAQADGAVEVLQQALDDVRHSDVAEEPR